MSFIKKSKYIYQYKDHLGNVRLTYADSDNNGAVDSSEIISEKNYYPFGMTHSGYNNVVLSENNHFDYNGKELDKSLGLNWLDLGARMYDPAIGRFMVIDPMADFVNYQSPYVVADNNPIANIDIYGLGKCGWICRTVNKILYSEEKLNGNGRLRSKWDGKTGMRYPPKNKKGEVASNDKKEDCNTCNNSDKGSTAIPKISFDTEINVDLASLSKSKLPKLGRLNPRIDPPTLEFDGPITSIPTNINFIGGALGTVLDKENAQTNKTLNAIIRTLVEYPHLKLMMYIKQQRDPLYKDSFDVERHKRIISQRAASIMKFLKGQGIDPNRIEWDYHPEKFSKPGPHTNEHIMELRDNKK